uniref:Uncharacterized protein n=1 Tax=Nelumbo nucifera TaxID=4432 RepID=A0A822YZ58_NELNU|nr:TPA_asm: hypothetical protein HUJ06_008448 [Nelumbo nucifera]
MVGYEHPTIPKETTLQALNTIIKFHFEKTLEKKQAFDLEKKELWKLFQFFFLFLGLCRHCWVPIALLTMAHLIFYVSLWCHKLTLRLATKRLKWIKLRRNNGLANEMHDFKIQFQQPPLSYFGKLKRKWTVHIRFLILIYIFMVFSLVALPCS